MLPGGAHRQVVARSSGVTTPSQRSDFTSLPDALLVKILSSTDIDTLRTARLVNKSIHTSATACISHISIDAASTTKKGITDILRKLPGLTTMSIRFPSLTKLALLDVPGVKERLIALTLNVRCSSPSLNATIRSKTTGAQRLTSLTLLNAMDKAMPVLHDWQSVLALDLGTWTQGKPGVDGSTLRDGLQFEELLSLHNLRELTGSRFSRAFWEICIPRLTALTNLQALCEMDRVDDSTYHVHCMLNLYFWRMSASQAASIVEGLAALTTLTRQEVHMAPQADLSPFSALFRLHTLRLSIREYLCNQPDCHILAALAPLTGLQDFELDAGPLSLEQLGPLMSQLQGLTRICIDNKAAGNALDRSLLSMLPLHNLQTLEINTAWVEGTDASHWRNVLMHASRLERLVVKMPLEGDRQAVLECLPGLTSLTSLYLDVRPPWMPGGDDIKYRELALLEAQGPPFSFLRSLTRITDLTLWITERDFIRGACRDVGQLVNLRRLMLRGWAFDVAQDSMACLTKMRSLEYLDLGIRVCTHGD